MKRWAVVVVVVAVPASAQVRPALTQLEQQLPAGWTVLATDTELVIRHDRPCYLLREPHENDPGIAAVPSGGPLVNLELRYKLEPRWTAQQLADAKARNAKVARQVAALRTRFRIDSIHTSKGRPLPMNADERGRLAAFETKEAEARTEEVRLPHCTFGTASLFDSDDTYRQLMLELDPPQASREAHEIVALVDKLCAPN
ncbi:MAG TPA: hypothetical protein VLX92_05085 [Kofleriaceae bacterium]|nr:hypothetical protein [Kofleriaceae bacterium]